MIIMMWNHGLNYLIKTGSKHPFFMEMEVLLTETQKHTRHMHDFISIVKFQIMDMVVLMVIINVNFVV